MPTPYRRPDRSSLCPGLFQDSTLLRATRRGDFTRLGISSIIWNTPDRSRRWRSASTADSWAAAVARSSTRHRETPYVTCRLAWPCRPASTPRTGIRCCGTCRRSPAASRREWWSSTPRDRRSAAAPDGILPGTSPACWSPTSLDSSPAGRWRSPCLASDVSAQR